MSNHLRRMNEDDIPEILKIQGELGFQAWTNAQFLQEIHTTNSFSFVLENGTIQGYAVFRFAGDELELLTIAIAPIFQRKGLATQLFSKALEEVEACVCVLNLYLEVSEKNEGAKEFYKKMGFSSVGLRKGYYLNGESAILMRQERGN